MKKLTIIALLIFFVISLGAQKREKIKGTGDVVKVNRSTSEYNGVVASDFFDIQLVEGIEGELALTGQANILALIDTYVENGILNIKPSTKARLLPSKRVGVQIIIPVETIESITLSGSGTLYGVNPIKTENLSVRVSEKCSANLTIVTEYVSVKTWSDGKVELAGRSKILEASLAGDGNLNSTKLQVTKAKISSSGSSRARIVVSELLTASASGGGHIRYLGNPEKVDKKISGDGKISVTNM